MFLSEVIECLQRRLEKHGEREVLLTWEGIYRNIRTKDIYLETSGEIAINCDEDDGLMYKRSYTGSSSPPRAVDPNEGEDGL